MSEDSPASRLIIPARMLNEWTYCRRLGILMWVHAEFAHSADTVDGAWKHRRADRPGPDLPEALDEGEAMVTRSLWLSSEREGITARMDVVEMEGDTVAPVDTKRGKQPDVPGGAWEPEKVQLCAQGLVLRDHGHTCERGYLYYAESRRRVEVVFDDALVTRTRELAAAFREAAVERELPPPLDRSPKCPRCSLVEICLPDETSLLAAADPGQGRGKSDAAPRQLLVPRSEALPLYVSTQGARIGVREGRFRVAARGKEVLAEVRIRDTSSIGVFGMVQVTTQALRAAMDSGIPVCFFSFGGWFVGMASGHPHKNVVLRQAQYRGASDPELSLSVARAIVRSKIRNQRTLLRRNHPDLPKAVLGELSRLARAARRAKAADTLLGLEGSAARLYFRMLPGMFKPQAGPRSQTTAEAGDPQALPGMPEPGKSDLVASFDFTHRNRRPPRDPVNALLSYAYSLLVRDLLVAALAAGLDPYMGFYHAPRYGKPALALDLMEELRPIVADSVVITAINNGEVAPSDFVHRANGCNLTSAGRRAFLRAYERRMDQLITHPVFGYRLTWRRVLEVQARLLGRFLLGEIPAYLPIETR